MGQGNKKPDEKISIGFASRLKQFVGDRENAMFGEKIGVSGEMVKKYLCGSLPRPDVLYEISKTTGKSMEWFITGEEKHQDACPINCDEKMMGLCSEVKNVMSSGTRYSRALNENIHAFNTAVEELKKADADRNLMRMEMNDLRETVFELQKELDVLKNKDQLKPNTDTD